MNYKGKIPKIPELPQNIKFAVNNRTLAVFIGAGVSRLIGCMGWDQLAKNLVNKCFTLKKEDGSTIINYKERETLLYDSDHKKVITICFYLLKENSYGNIFYEELENSFKKNEDLLNTQNIYKEIYYLRGLFITTNADEHFDIYFEPHRIFYREEDFQEINIDRNNLYHIHGSVRDRSSLIFTVPQYIDRYNKKTFRNFLKRIFKEYTVLFLGYGMAEFELLDFLITKNDLTKGKELKHYILRPFYRDEENILKFEKYYYNSMGIEVLPYEKDEKGYGQLYEVIKSWNREINQVSNYLYKTYEEIDETIITYTDEKAKNIFQIIKNDEPQRNYFFNRLASCQSPFPWLKQLKKRRYFDPQNNPKPQEDPYNKGFFSIPYWPVLSFLENVAKKNEENPSDEITEELIEIIDQLINYKYEEGKRIENYRTDWILIKIAFSLPKDKIKREYIEFIGTALNSGWNNSLIASEISKTIIPKLLKYKLKDHLLSLLHIIFDFKKIKRENVFYLGEVFEFESILEEYWLRDALKSNKKEIVKLCGLEAAKIALNVMERILIEDKNQFNLVWIPTIENSSQINFPDQYEYQLVSFVRDMFELSAPETIKNKIKELIKSDFLIFRRIGIHIINVHYKQLNELFWNWGINPFDEEIVNKHEFYELLKNNCIYFSKDQIKKIVKWIENGNYYIPKDLLKDKWKILAQTKKEWLSTLLDTNDPEVKSLYNKYNEIIPTEPEHPGFDIWTESLVGTVSPVEKNELFEQSNEEIAEYLINFKEETGWNKPTVDGLSRTLRSLVNENPYKFTNNIKPFLKVPRVYQQALLSGFHDLWRRQKDIDWEVILEFVLNIIENDSFWHEIYEEGSFNYRNWLISVISDLIKEGTQKDEHSFDPKLLPKTKKILLIFLNNTKSDLSESIDLVTAVLNSTKGRIFSALINYSLRYARIYKKNEENKWDETIQLEFSKRLDRELEPTFEFSVILGQYLSNIRYLNENWVNENINRIFPKENEDHWRAAFTGYLFYGTTVYLDLYKILRKNSHYEKAINTNFEDPKLNERLIQHLCIGYLQDWEDLNDPESLIAKIFKRNNPKYFSYTIQYFWMLRKNINNKIKLKIKPLWKKLFNALIVNESNLEYQKLFSQLSLWSVLIDQIDEDIFNWLKLSAKYISLDFKVPYFIEYLLKHVENSPKEVGELYLIMLNSKTFPDYKKENVQEIVRILYEKNEKVITDKICNLYGTNGYDFLREIYIKYNQ